MKKLINIPFGSPMISKKDKEQVLDVLNGHMLTHGPKCEEFESKFADYIGVKHAITTSNCTTAIHLGLVANEIKAGDEVIVPAMTHVATAHAVEHCGAKPIFVDVDIETGCINPELIEAKITKKTKAIIVVHFVGLPCDMEKILVIASKFNLRVIEDSATALGAFIDRKQTGTFGDVGCFSFYPTKHITSFEGGMLTTNNDIIAKKVKTHKAFGYNKNLKDRLIPGIYDIDNIGWNYRMSEGHAALGLSQLSRLDYFLSCRRKSANIIEDKIHNLNRLSYIPFVSKKRKSSWYCINIMIEKDFKISRNNIIKKLNDLGIGTSVHYPVALPNSIYYSSKYGYEKKIFHLQIK